LETATHPDMDAMLDALQKQDVKKLCTGLGNILEPVALTLCPEVMKIERTLLEMGALGACMSGSGPTVFGLFTDGNDAIEAAEYFMDHGYAERSFVTKFYQPPQKRRLVYDDILRTM